MGLPHIAIGGKGDLKMCISRAGIPQAYDVRQDQYTEVMAMERALECGDKEGYGRASIRYEELCKRG